LPLHYIDVVARVGSIRKAADRLAITSTALNRRILSMEEELGVPLFERLPTGVRLSVAGELFVHHVRKQLSDLQKVKSQISDLSGERRGHVSLVCGQALLESFIPEMIVLYRKQHPGVTFDVRVCNRFGARAPLVDYSADIAIVFEPESFQEFQQVIEVPQTVRAVFNQNHPLALKKSLRLSDCIEYPLALPSRSNGVRNLIEQSAVRQTQRLNVVIESDSHTLLRQCLTDNDVVSFQIPIYAPKNDELNGFTWNPLSSKDVAAGRLVAGQLKGRTLPVASARFLEQVSNELHQRYGD